MIVLWIILGIVIWISLGCFSSWYLIRKVNKMFPVEPPRKWYTEDLFPLILCCGFGSIIGLGFILLIDPEFRKA